jgi:hypothetical protein
MENTIHEISDSQKIIDELHAVLCPHRLRRLATWLDVKYGPSDDNEVQRDLRHYANLLESVEASKPNLVPRRYVCEACGGTGRDNGGNSIFKSTAPEKGVCYLCGGSGRLGIVSAS